MKTVTIEEPKLPASKVIGEKKTLQLKASITPSDATDKAVTWESNKPAIATVDNAGIVTGVKAGTTSITATSNNGKTGTLEVTVKPATTAITITGHKDLNKQDLTVTLGTTVKPEGAHDKFEWSSSNSTIASVNENGVVTALKDGKFKITAKAIDGSGIEKETAEMTVSGFGSGH